jgi:hypothetical protein
MLASLLLLSLLGWQADLSPGMATLQGQPDYPAAVAHLNGQTVLTANPNEEGWASAWMYQEKIGKVPVGTELALTLKGNGRSLRLRYFYLGPDPGLYYSSTEYVKTDGQWQTVRLPLSQAGPFYSSNFPWAMVPDKRVEFYLFVENGEPGPFQVTLSRVALEKGGTEK